MVTSGVEWYKDGHGYLKKYFLFTYSTEHLSKTDKVRFYYALKGRDGKSGVVLEYSIIHLGRTVLLVPEKYSDQSKKFLEHWNCKFEVKEVFMHD